MTYQLLKFSCHIAIKENKCSSTTCIHLHRTSSKCFQSLPHFCRIANILLATICRENTTLKSNQPNPNRNLFAYNPQTIQTILFYFHLNAITCWSIKVVQSSSAEVRKTSFMVSFLVEIGHPTCDCVLTANIPRTTFIDSRKLAGYNV